MLSRAAVAWGLSTVVALVAVMTVAVSAVLAQPGAPSFERITTRDGLADNHVLCLLQDRRGFMWFGTRDGLNKYDGYTFTVYKHDPEDHRSISDGGIDCILEDSEGNIWVGTSLGGLNRFDHVTGSFMSFRHDPHDERTIAGDRVLSVCEDGRGDIWVVTGNTEGARLSRFDKRAGVFVRYRSDPSNPFGLASDWATSVRRARNGDVWIGTEDCGLCRYEQATNRFITCRSDVRYRVPMLASVTIISVDAGEDLWCMASTTGMFRIPTHDGIVESENIVRYNASEYVTSVFQDGTGALWFGTAYAGLQMVDEATGIQRRFQYDVTDPSSLQSNRVFCLGRDWAGNLWVGTDNGISKLNKRSWYFKHYRHSPLDSSGLSHSDVRSVFIDDRGALWVGTAGSGLNVLKPGANAFLRYDLYKRSRARVLYSRSPQLPIDYNTVNAIYPDHRGIFWIGTNAGLMRFVPATGEARLYRHDPADPRSIGMGGAWAILRDLDGDLWVGTLRGGVSRFDEQSGTFVRYEHDPLNSNGVSHNSIHCLHVDRQGRLWIGSDNGLDLFDKRSGRWTHYRHEPDVATSLSHNRVWYLYEARDGGLWVGTSGGGVNRMISESGVFVRYTEKDGLANNIVCGIMEDNHGALWITTNNGLSRFDQATGSFKTYNADDGLPVHEFHFKACWRERSGVMLAGGRNGVIEFYPDSIRDNPISPQLVLTAFRVFGERLVLDTAVDLKRTIYLNHDDNFFSIEFAALDLTSPLRNQYRYKLEGVDVGWRTVDAVGKPYASYTDVPPGTYLFRLVGSNSDGVWNSAGISMEIIVMPAYWQTLWFKGALGCVLALAAGTVLALRIRSVRRKAEFERKLAETKLQGLQSQMNPHFVFNSLNSILHFIVAHDAASAYKYLSKFSRLIRSILEHSQRAYIPLADEIEGLKLYLDLEALRCDHRFTYRVEVDPSIDVDLAEIPPMLIQPYVENAVKHGLTDKEEGGMLLVRLERSGDQLLCSVIDNGIGRAQAQALKGRYAGKFKSMGMQVTRERLEMLNGTFGARYSVQVIDLVDEDQQPRGTQVDIRMPIS